MVSPKLVLRVFCLFVLVLFLSNEATAAKKKFYCKVLQNRCRVKLFPVYYRQPSYAPYYKYIYAINRKKFYGNYWMYYYLLSLLKFDFSGCFPPQYGSKICRTKYRLLRAVVWYRGCTDFIVLPYYQRLQYAVCRNLRCRYCKKTKKTCFCCVPTNTLQYQWAIVYRVCPPIFGYKAVRLALPTCCECKKFKHKCHY